MVQIPVLPPSATSRQHKHQPRAVSTNSSHEPSAQTSATSRQHKQQPQAVSTNSSHKPSAQTVVKSLEEKKGGKSTGPCTPTILTTPVSVHVSLYNTHYTCVCLHTVYLYNTHCTCVCPCVYTPCTPATLATPVSVQCSIHRVPRLQHSTPVSVHVSTHRVPLQHSLHLCLSMCLHTGYPCNTHCTCPCVYTPCTPTTLTAPAPNSKHWFTTSFLPWRKVLESGARSVHLPMCLHTVYRTLQHSLY